MERLTYLELAVWKATCVSDMPSSYLSMSSLYDVMQWVKGHWKTIKDDERSSNSIEIVMQRILPFLDEATSPPSAASYLWVINRERRRLSLMRPYWWGRKRRMTILNRALGNQLVLDQLLISLEVPTS